jgi:hypothetical protein
MRRVVFSLAGVRSMRLDMLVMLLDRVGIHVIQNLHAQLKIRQQLIASRLGKILSDDYTQHLEILGVRGHSVGWHNPGALAQLVSECELVVVLVGLGVEAESDERETVSTLLGHDYETQLLE